MCARLRVAVFCVWSIAVSLRVGDRSHAAMTAMCSLQLMRDEICMAMQLLGVRSLADLNASYVVTDSVRAHTTGPKDYASLHSYVPMLAKL